MASGTRRLQAWHSSALSHLLLLLLLPTAAAVTSDKPRSTSVTPLLVLGPPIRSLAASVVSADAQRTTFQVACPSGPDRDPNCPRHDFWPPATIYHGEGSIFGGYITGRPGFGATTVWECTLAEDGAAGQCATTILGPPPDFSIAEGTTLNSCDVARMSVPVILTAGLYKLEGLTPASETGPAATGDAASLYSSFQSRLSSLGCATSPSSSTPATTSAPTVVETSSAMASSTNTPSGAATGTSPTTTSASSHMEASWGLRHITLVFGVLGMICVYL